MFNHVNIISKMFKFVNIKGKRICIKNACLSKDNTLSLEGGLGLGLELGKKIKELRIDKDLTARELSERSGVARSLISQLETGKRQSTGMDTISRLAKALDVPLSNFFADKSDSACQAPYKSMDDFQQFLIREENLTYLDSLRKAQMAGLTPDLLNELIELIIRIRLKPSSN